MFQIVVLVIFVALVKTETFHSSLTGECKDALGCFCDYECKIKGDCCDAVRQSELFNQSLSTGGKTTKSICIPFNKIFPEYEVEYERKYFRAIASCPDDSEIPIDLTQNCAIALQGSTPYFAMDNERFEWLKQNLRYLAPVVDVSERKVYGNIDCAICNGVFGTFQKPISVQQVKRHLIVYPLRVACGEMSNRTYCETSSQLPKSLTRMCPVPRRRGFMFPNPMTSLSLDELFVMPDDYFTSKPIRLPFEVEKLNNSTAVSKLEPSWDIMSYLFYWIQMTLVLFSILALSVMLVVYSSHSKLHASLAGRLTIGLAVALLCFQICFLIISFVIPQVNSRGFCVTMATTLFYCLLCSFMWMALFAAQLLQTFANCKNCLLTVCGILTCACLRKSADGHRRNVRTLYTGSQQHHSSTKARFRKHLLVAILLPLCLVIPALWINEYAYSELAPYYANISVNTTEEKWSSTGLVFNVSQEDVLGPILAQINPGFCLGHETNRAWFSTRIGLTIWFLAPAATMITFNALALLIVCIQIFLLRKETHLQAGPQNEQERRRQERSKNLASICVKLAIILGGTWFIQVIAGWRPELDVLRKLAALANSAQGGIIAVSMLLSTKARRVMEKQLPACCQTLTPTTTTDRQGGDGTTSTTNTSRTWTSGILPKGDRPKKAPSSSVESKEI